MKLPILITLALLALSSPAQSQFLLNAGDQYVFQFSSLTLSYTEPADDPFKSSPHGSFTLSRTLFPGNPSVQYRLEMFEDSLSEAPVASALFDSSISPAGISECNAEGAWSDLQGAVRVTGVSGSLQLDWMSFISILDQPDGTMKVYHLYQPVPEPSTLGLCGVALFASVGWLGMKRRKSRTS